MTGDARWYEAAFVVGITNALNVVADGLAPAAGPPLVALLDEASASEELRDVFAEIRAFYGGADVPVPFRAIAHDAGYLTDLWRATRRAFDDQALERRFKEALAFAVSLTTRSPFGTPVHLGEARRLGMTERGVTEVIGVTQMFSSYTKIADTLQLESDMRDLAPPDPSPAPGGPARGRSIAPG